MNLDLHAPDEGAFEPTYTGGRLERAWLLEALAGDYEDRLITDILYKVKGGKEANVYCCAAHPDTGYDLLAAKVYRPEAFRAMKNDGLYRFGREELNSDGRAIRDNRAQRAMQKRTKVGRAMRSASWIHYEYQTLCDLYIGGADVPEPIAISDRAILMAYIGDEQRAAPTLHEVDLPPHLLRPVFDAVMRNVRIMLDHRRIHADLSAYNILFDGERPVIIDLPQCIDPLTHPQGYALLARDIERVCDYFNRRNMRVTPHQLTESLWREI